MFSSRGALEGLLPKRTVEWPVADLFCTRSRCVHVCSANIVGGYMREGSEGGQKGRIDANSPRSALALGNGFSIVVYHCRLSSPPVGGPDLVRTFDLVKRPSNSRQG